MIKVKTLFLFFFSLLKRSKGFRSRGVLGEDALPGGVLEEVLTERSPGGLL